MSMATSDKFHILSLTESGAQKAKQELFKLFADEHSDEDKIASEFSQALRPHRGLQQDNDFVQLTLSIDGNHKVSDKISEVHKILIQKFPECGFIHENAFLEFDVHIHYFGIGVQYGISRYSNGLEWHGRYVRQEPNLSSGEVLELLRANAKVAGECDRNQGGAQ